jgi:hypothetical protein
MRALIKGLVVVASLLGAISPARACDVTAQFLCANDPTKPVASETIFFEKLWSANEGYDGMASFSLVTDANGNLGPTHIAWDTNWNVTYYPNNPFVCGATGQNQLGTIYVPATHPKCAPVPECTVTLPKDENGQPVNPFTLGAPLGNPRAECKFFGLAALDKNDGLSGQTWTATTAARLALVKAGLWYRYYLDGQAGDTLQSPNGQGISHVTYCTCP